MAPVADLAIVGARALHRVGRAAGITVSVSDSLTDLRDKLLLQAKTKQEKKARKMHSASGRTVKKRKQVT